ncbi:hypothetical protein THRCLA_04298 [Thraustotheca clavata]|uniref:Uncharacterized protein n=1 Tax=Thraustotheca clavata TaxID=74557 RepID=A0A1V9ZZE0_9STRA|nr:hypothetical protein THRCLA_04298 [Thraustotheca clavata]
MAEEARRRTMDINELITPTPLPWTIEPRFFGKKPLKEKDTRSKARPGFRKGKWTEEESVYAERMSYYFKEGLLPLEKGTMLRMYLAEKLNCEPMRITKKFTGDECIGKQIFRPMPPTPLVSVRMQSVQAELKALETAFLNRIEEMPMYCMSTKQHDKEPKIIKRGKRLRKVVAKPTEPLPIKAKDPPEDAQAANLLLGFFHGAGTPEETTTTSVAAVSPIPISSQPLASNHPISPSVKCVDMLPPIVHRSTRKFSISHCAEEFELYVKRPRLDSLSLCTSNC